MEAPLLSDLRADVPADLAALIARMMAKEPDRRFQAPDEVAKALESIVNVRPETVTLNDRISPGRRRLVLARGLALSAIGMVIFATYFATERGDLLQKNLIVNGSFENGPQVGLDLRLGGGSTAISGWTVSRGGIGYIGHDFWKPADGKRSLHVSPGGIKQSIKTRRGQRYRISFLMAGNPEFNINSPVKVLLLCAGRQTTEIPLRYHAVVMAQHGLGGEDLGLRGCERADDRRILHAAIRTVNRAPWPGPRRCSCCRPPGQGVMAFRRLHAV